MKMINAVLTFLVLFSCKPQNDFSGVDLKDYFWVISDYETPKVIVYDFDSLGTMSRNYYLIKKVSDDKLALTRYDANFNETQFLIDKYVDDGVVLEKSSFVEDMANKVVTDVEISEGFIFPFNSQAKIVISSSFTPQTDNKIKVTNKDFGELIYMTEKEINGKMSQTIIGKGYTERKIENIMSGQHQTFKIKLETWYTKDIGITMMKQVYPFGEYTDKFVEFISIDEFNKLKDKKL